VLLLDHPRAVAQLAGLESKTNPSGKDRIDHPLNGHDDIANSIADAAVLASQDPQHPEILNYFFRLWASSVSGGAELKKMVLKS
jgi:hypothetical protein